jgi:hypothetical protein
MEILIGYINSGSLEAEVLPEEYVGVCTRNDPHSGKKRVKTIYSISVLSNEKLYIVCEARDEDKPVEAKESLPAVEAKESLPAVEAKESLPAVDFGPRWEANLPDFLSVKVRF